MAFIALKTMSRPAFDTPVKVRGYFCHFSACNDEVKLIVCMSLFPCLFQSVALDPEFSKKRTKMYVTGGTKVCCFPFSY